MPPSSPMGFGTPGPQTNQPRPPLPFRMNRNAVSLSGAEWVVPLHVLSTITSRPVTNHTLHIIQCLCDCAVKSWVWSCKGRDIPDWVAHVSWLACVCASTSNGHQPTYIQYITRHHEWVSVLSACPRTCSTECPPMH